MIQGFHTYLPSTLYKDYVRVPSPLRLALFFTNRTQIIQTVYMCTGAGVAPSRQSFSHAILCPVRREVGAFGPNNQPATQSRLQGSGQIALLLSGMYQRPFLQGSVSLPSTSVRR